MKIRYTKKINLKLAAVLLLVLAVLLECYLGFISLYPAFEPKPEPVPAKIIKVDRTGFTEVINFLSKLDTYQPKDRIFVHPNPFKYSP